MGQALVVVGGLLVTDLLLWLLFGHAGRRLLAGLLAFGLPLLALVGLASLAARAFERRG